MPRPCPPCLLVLALALAACATGPAGTAEPHSTHTTPPPSMPPATDPASAGVPSPSASERPSATPEPIAWRRIDATGPAAREDATWTLDPDRRVAYLFGGRDGQTVFGDLWAFDLDADRWTAVDVSDGPPARFGHEAAWVDGIGLVVLLGQAGSTFFNDLWAFDPAGAGWQSLPSAGAVPRERYGSCAALGPDGRLWISHGFTADGARFADTRAYAFDTGTWSDETPEGDVPVNRCLHGCWWTDAGAFALDAGQTTGITAIGDRWELANGAWTRIEDAGPPARNLAARVRVAGATLAFGGQGVDGGYLADAWLLRDGAPAQAVSWRGEGPPGRSGAEMIADGDRLLLFGGRDAGRAFADTWELRGVRPIGD